jgi:tetratricopeptide (TPR) repeat protein
MTLTNIGRVYYFLRDKDKALDYFTQALPLFRTVGHPLGEALTLSHLMRYWREEQNPPLAIFFGKQAVDRLQQIRRNIQGLEKDVQQSFLSSKEDVYRELADLLISQGASGKPNRY